jgi:hypothetical protein
MSNFPALEVAIGLSFIYFIFSLVCSAITEWIATKLEWRARMLEVAVENIFSGSYAITAAGQALAAEFWSHPLIQALQRPKSEKLTRRPSSKPPNTEPATQRGVKRPSYVASRTFVLAVLDLGARAHVEAARKSGAKSAPAVASVTLEQQINAIGNDEMRDALLTLYRDANGKAHQFRRSAEQWFDDSMERVSGWYKRRVQLILAATAIVIVLIMNIDTLQIAQTLWRDDAARATIVAQAEQPTKPGARETQPSNAAKALPVPVGWKLFETGTDPQEFPDTAGSILSKILGLLITTAALTLGAPFWFDLLSKFVRVRGTGAPPPATDAVRQGEGEERRTGDLAPAGGPS